ncbi:unnamed protein product [Thlaspi arvense]|uniref:Morc S5 domain-containing protein n=1 Tax=Thlaspi arvense TaxID=13288 RepID=A0AAU9SUV6_THLAR|nr:unnamed protein product [Thlaspi arvense]
MDSSSQTKPKKSLLVVGGPTNSASANPKPYGVSGSTSAGFSKPGLKRDSKNHDNGDDNSLSSKKARTMVDSQDGKTIVPLDVRPLAIVEPQTPKLSRQFWKAGDDIEDEPVPHYCSNDAAVRVHPQFLHANATSHKWALGALAELLDNSLDEVCNGATYVHVDSTTNDKDGKSSILIVEDNGGGMNPNRFRECLSLGYSRKRNMANTVGQYGNGFKTSTMRLGADAIVFSRCRGTNGNNATQSVGMLSYTYLYETRKCEAVVPTVDFEFVGNEWKPITYNSTDEWLDNIDTIEKWSPYLSQQDLFNQFDSLKEQGTRIVIYNLWEDDERKLELDFDTDPHDIQLRGANRDEKNIDMAKTYPNSRHFLTYRHSLRSYASILYLRLPPNFKIILRGKDVEHHSLLDDMMMTDDITYRPVRSPECSQEDDLVATLKIGFVKDAAHRHNDIQGFNVYHKNRLIKPFWRVWNAAGSDGRGVIGILEANFIQPAHNKQGFERTAVLAKLENRLITYQKNYWFSRCHEIGYAIRRKQNKHASVATETTPQREQKSGVTPNKNHDKGSFSNPAPARSRLNVDTSGGNRNSHEGVTQSSVAGRNPDIWLNNVNPGNGNGISSKETRSVDHAAELQKVKDESAKRMAELQRQNALLESQISLSNTNQLKEAKAKNHHDLEKSQKVKDEAAKQAAELQMQKQLLVSMLKDSNVKIHDLEISLKVNDESVKLVAELQKQNEQLETQVKTLFFFLNQFRPLYKLLPCWQ